MKRKFYRSCVAVLLSMVMIFGGVHIGAAADGGILPFGPVVPPGVTPISVTAPQSVMAKGDTQTLVVNSVSGGTLTWSSSNTSVATVDSNGVVTALAVGTVTITGRYSFYGSVYTDSVSIQVVNPVLGIKNATEYYIMSANDMLIGLDQEEDENNTRIYAINRAPNSYLSQWKVELQADGTVQFINVYSPTSKCLTVIYEGGVGDYDEQYTEYVYMSTDTNAENQKFTLERVTSGEYEGLYLIKQGDLFVGHSDTTANRVWLIENIDESCYWSLMAVEKRWAELFAFNYEYTENEEGDSFVTTQCSNYFRNIMDSLGYVDLAYENYGSVSAYSFLRDRDDIFVYNGHAFPGMLTFMGSNEDNEEELKGRILANTGMGFDEDIESYYISDLDYNALCLARCVLYIGCQTANDSGNYNLLDETFAKGAHFVLGAQNNITVGDAEDFLTVFLRNVLNGENIEKCMVEAERAEANFIADHRGDTKQYLN